MGNSDWRPFCSPIRDQGNCGCYDDQTEVLTRKGWKLFKDLVMEDEILCFDPFTRELKYYKPTNLFTYDYEGEMIQIKGKSIDLLITPNHNMLVYPWDESNRTISQNPKFIQAQHLGFYFNIPCGGKWTGDSPNVFHLNGVQIGEYTTPFGGKGLGYRKGIDVPMESWVKFLGLYLAEGYVTLNNHYEVGIAAVTPEKQCKIKEILSGIPLHYRKKANRYTIYDKRLALELHPLGQAREKHIPEYIKQLEPELLWKFIEGFALGDGQYIEERDTFRLYTSSKRLADDLQESILKAGRWAQISHRSGRISFLKNRKIIGSDEYSLYISKRKHLAVERKSMVKRVKYTGKVYCAEVPTHAMVVRRNGKPVISGNSCTAFGTIGAWETCIRIAENNPNDPIDLSERDLFVCSGGYCALGNTMENVLNKALSGVALESCCPYDGLDHLCGEGRCPDWTKTGKRLRSYREVTDREEMKQLLNKEALVGVMTVHQSFINYKEGVYHSLGYSDPILGGHAIAIVGYNDDLQAWLVRNSWGTSWGMEGYAWVAYGDSEIDQIMYEIIPDGPINPIPSPCKLGNAIAKFLNFFAWLFHRKGRFFYLNP